MALNSMQEIFEKAASRSIPFWRVVLETDMEERQVTEEQSMEKMRAAWHAMLESVVSYQGDQRSRSGLVGGDGAQMRRYAAADTTYSGPYVQEVIATALSVGESNACTNRRRLRCTACGTGASVPDGPRHRGRDFAGSVYRFRHRRGGQLPGLYRRCFRRLSG